MIAPYRTVGQYPPGMYVPPGYQQPAAPTFLESLASFIPGALGTYFQKRQADKAEKFQLKMAQINMPLQQAQLKWGAEVKKAAMIPLAVGLGVVGLGVGFWWWSKSKKKGE